MRSARHREQREGVWRRRFGLLVTLALVGGLGFVAWAKLEWTRPDAELIHPVSALGRTATVDVRLHDARSGLSRSRVEIESGGSRTLLDSREYPAASWLAGSVHETTLSLPLRALELKIPEGPATVRVYADDYSWLRWFRAERPALESQATIDLTPPTLEVLWGG